MPQYRYQCEPHRYEKWKHQYSFYSVKYEMCEQDNFEMGQNKETHIF